MGSEWCIHFKDESTMTFYYDEQREGDYEYFLEPYEENEVANIAGDKLTLVDFRSLDREDAHGQSMIISIKENGFMPQLSQLILGYKALLSRHRASSNC